ncbi:tetratricopeptide repeat protein [bacterium]|nr:tetratricopeptide repeat protein [bacterium]
MQYSLSENFNPNNINCIAIGKIKDNSNNNEYKSLDKVTLIRHAIYGHLSPKNYQDVELHKVAFVMKSSNTNQLILKNLDCDALLEGTITEFKNNFYLAYSSTNVGLSLFLKDKDNQVLWKASHTAKSVAGSMPFSPIGLATGLFSASSNTEDEVAFQMIDTVVRRVLKTLPETSNVENKNQLKHAAIPKTKTTKIPNKQVTIKQKSPTVLFASGQYGQAIDLINTNLKLNINNDKLIFLKGRSQLMLNQYEKATSTFLDALAIKMDSDYLNGLGYAYTKLKQTDKALAAYNKAISINNKNSYAYFNSGLLLENKGNKKRAADYFYSAGTSSLLNKDFLKANNAHDALQRLSKGKNIILEKSNKLGNLIKELTEDKDNDFKIIKINTKGD